MEVDTNSQHLKKSAIPKPQTITVQYSTVQYLMLVPDGRSECECDIEVNLE